MCAVPKECLRSEAIAGLNESQLTGFYNHGVEVTNERLQVLRLEIRSIRGFSKSVICSLDLLTFDRENHSYKKNYVSSCDGHLGRPYGRRWDGNCLTPIIILHVTICTIESACVAKYIWL